MDSQIAELKVAELLRCYPHTADFFSSIGLKTLPPEPTVVQMLAELPFDFWQECGMEPQRVLEHLSDFITRMEALQGLTGGAIASVTLIGGRDKNGVAESFSLTLRPGEIVSIVGPTGAGKSRLLADIECLAQRDTPSKRQVLLDGKVPDASRRFALEHKLVAQLSQNMNFVVDLSVMDFVTMHAESRMVADVSLMVAAVIACANELAGERFEPESSLTQLSGGQSRALMIADTALLSASPIVLIDEIENAGVDRKKALELLVRKEKLVLLATHDPILALLGQKRIVIKNGGIAKIIATSGAEQANLGFLENIDRKLMKLRDCLRTGDTIDLDIEQFFYR